MTPFQEILSKGEYAYKKPTTRLMPYARYVSAHADKCTDIRKQNSLRVLSASAYYDAGQVGLARHELGLIKNHLLMPVDMVYQYRALWRKIDPEFEQVMTFYGAIHLLAMTQSKSYTTESEE